RVEVDDVLPDDVDDLRPGILRPVVQSVFCLAGFFCPALGRGDVADRSIEPDIEELVGFTRNPKPKVGAVPADVPIRQALLKELLKLIGDGRVQKPWLTNHPEQEILIPGEPKKKMTRLFSNRRRSADGAAGVDQIGR